MNKVQKIREFNPSGIGQPNGNLFGLPFTVDESEVVIIPVPWDVTASFRRGAAYGPAAVLEASYQIDLHDEDAPEAWKAGIAMLTGDGEIIALRHEFLKDADACIEHLEQSRSPKDPDFRSAQRKVDAAGERLNAWVQEKASGLLVQGKIVGVLGGDHSTPFGLLKALVARTPRFCILHIDAHLDLRFAYEGFTYSHASIMRNARLVNLLGRFVHVGIRDYCAEEAKTVAESAGRHVLFTDRSIRRMQFEGESWASIVSKILAPLPRMPLYVSFDIDGLDPSLCPNTGTPVPGGFSLEEVFYLLARAIEGGRQILGFDLSEVAPASPDPKTWASDWNANVGMRVLYRLAAFAAKSQGRI